MAEAPTTPFSEVGRSGLTQYSGIVREEFLKELQGAKAMKVYREMGDNDPIIGAMLFVIEQFARQVTYTVKPGAPDAQHLKQADFVATSLHDMSFTWAETQSEILTMLRFGFAYPEIVYKRRLGDNRDSTKRSRFTDGQIGWRKWAGRAQESLFDWQFDEEGGIQAMRQQPAPDYVLRTIPIEKALLFRTTSLKNNPEGKSLLRNAYRPWYFKKRIEEIEGIGIERDLAGLPMLTPPENLDLWNANDSNAVTQLATAEKLVRSIRRDEQEGIVKPFGWTLEGFNSGSRRNFNTSEIITRYETRMAMTTLADFLLMGHAKVGNFALVSSRTHTFAIAIAGYLDTIVEVINRHAIPRLLRMNGEPLDAPPTITHGDIESPDLGEVGKYIESLTKAGAPLFPDEPLMRHLMAIAHLPVSVEDGAESLEASQKRWEETSIRDVLEEIRDLVKSHNGDGNGTGS